MTACAFTEITPPARESSSDNLLPTLQAAGLQTLSGDGAWVGGVQFVPTPCGGGGVYHSECATGECLQKVANGLEASVKWTPWLVYSAVTCATFADRDEIEASAIATFNNSKSVISASELYYALGHRSDYEGLTCDDGSPYPINPFLADPVQYFPTSPDGAWANAETKLLDEGWRILLNTLADLATGTLAVIHVSPGLLSALVAEQLVVSSNGLYFSATGGHLVIGAPGYSGGSPSDDIVGNSPGYIWPGVEWIYVTGPMNLALGDVQTDTTLEHRRNNYFTVAEQFILPYFDPTCIQFGVPVTLDPNKEDTDFSDTGGAKAVTRINNDHIIACDPQSTGDFAGEEMSPDIYLGHTFHPFGV